MRIGIDIDNTLTDIEDDLMKAALTYAKSLGKIINNQYLESIDDNNDGNKYQKIFGFNYEELKYFLKVIQESITDNANPRPFTSEIIKSLHLDEHQIIIITARDTEFHDDPYKQSEMWLKKNNIYYDKLIVNARRKGEICKKEKIDLFIDDNISNCLDVTKCGIKTILFNKQKAKDGRIVSFENWKDIYDYIKKRKVNKMYDYVLQLGFDKKTEDYIQNIKNTLKENNVIDKEKNWRPHITIDLYNCNSQGQFIGAIDKVMKEIKSCEIEFNNLNNFEEETLYIEPFNKKVLYEIKNIFDNQLGEYRLEKRINRVYKPHVTLCTNQDLTKAKRISKDIFRPFKGKISYLWIYNPKLMLVKEYRLD